MTPPAFRFAPSPNGRLHLGHAYCALLNERLARACGGRLLLRLEDIDPLRCRPAFAAGVVEDLAWLGLRFEAPVRRQSEHLAGHAAALGRLRARGLTYPCFCSRREIAEAAARGGAAARDPDGTVLYPGTCRTLDAGASAARIAAGEPHAWRLDVAAALAAASAVAGPDLAHTAFGPEDLAPDGSVPPRRVPVAPARWGDAVVARKEVATSYHLAVTVDDAAQGVTHVVRGRDLLAATDLHVLLQRLLGLPTPAYHHHALLTEAGGAKLAKSAGSRPLAAWRAQGACPQDLRARLGFG